MVLGNFKTNSLKKLQHKLSLKLKRKPSKSLKTDADKS
jgi:hypothetical protein